MKKFVLELTDKEIQNVTLVGGKAVNLVKLTRLGYNVPPFFVLSSLAYQEFITRSHLFQNIIRLDKKSLSDQNEIRKALNELRKAILAQSLPAEIEEAIARAYEQFQGKAGSELHLVVRSSATAEDQPFYSFAGQLESYLNLKGLEAILTAIKQCWASAWSERAFFYCLSHRISAQNFSVAVIIQKMIPAQVAGVLFTVNPVTGNREQLMIEANWGLGTTIVAGIGGMDRYLVSKKNLSIIEIHLGDKTAADVPGADTIAGLTRIMLSGDKRQAQTLTLENIKKLGEIGKKLEAQFQEPQDIEWAFYDEQFYLLQTRPVTKIKKGVGPLDLVGQVAEKLSPDQIWTNYFFGERFPLPVSPLGWSILKRPIEKNAFREPLRFMGANQSARGQITRLFHERPYTRLSVFQTLHCWLPRSLILEDKRRLFFSEDRFSPPGRIKRMTILGSLFFSAFKDFNWFIPYHLRRWEKFVPQYLQKLDKINEAAFPQLTPDQLWEHLLQAEQATDELLSLHRWSITLAEILYHLVEKVIKRWVPEQSPELITELLSGLPGNKTVEMNEELWHLSQQMTHQSNLILNSFLQKYGHRSNSLDIFYPTWGENPSYVLNILRCYQELKDENAPPLIEHRNRTRRLQRTQQIQKKLSWWRAFVFQKILPVTQTFILLRENQRFYWHISLSKIRKIVVELGRRLHQRGILNQVEDVFFLKRVELEKCLLGFGDKKDLGQVIVLRKGRREAALKKTSPPLIYEGEKPEETKISGNRFQGIGVSPGKVYGRAAVLRNLADFPRLQKGDILITSSIDPGWTPLLGMVSGLVLEVGGMLSHASILAREFGLPAVTSVTGATQKFHTGERLYLDGDQGIIIRQEGSW
ncbi:MAG: PEP-utilizing enzyme [candidate division KSB1 bacterium]|nr:PEP-utilizing enzyme [candidate division KSB1 bacterium]